MQTFAITLGATHTFSHKLNRCHRYTGDPRPRIPLYVMVLSAIGLKLGGLPNTHTQNKMQNKCAHDLHVLCSILRIFIFTMQTAVHALTIIHT